MIISSEELTKIKKLNSIYLGIAGCIRKLKEDKTLTEVEKRKIEVISTATKIRIFPKGLIEDPLLVTMINDDEYEVTDTWVMAKDDLEETMESIAHLTLYISKISRDMEYRESGIYHTTNSRSNKMMNSSNIKTLKTHIYATHTMLHEEGGKEQEEGGKGNRLNTLLKSLVSGGMHK